jgi:hypothetical protein
VRTLYSIPLPPRFRMRVLGLPTLDLIHSAGMAWTAADSPSFRQNVGLRLRYRVLFVRAVANPDDFTSDVEFGFGLDLPPPARPWQTPR